MAIGEVLRDLRKANGLTQGELAERVGLSAMSIRRYEKGLRTLEFDIWLKCAEVLGMSKHDAEAVFVDTILDSWDWIEEQARKKAEVINAGAQLLSEFYKLNSEGQRKAIEHTRDLAKVPEYRSDDNGEAQ